MYSGLLGSLKKENPVIFYSVGESRGHYDKQNKPVTRGQILYESTCMKYLK